MADDIKLKCEQMPAGIAGNLSTSRALYAFFRANIELGRGRHNKSQLCKRYLREGVHKADEMQTDDCQIPLPSELTQSGVRLLYKRGGRVVGLRSWVQTFHPNLQIVLIRVWDDLQSTSVIDGLYGNGDEHNLKDVVIFAAYLPRHRRKTKAVLPQCLLVSHRLLSMSLTNWIATMVSPLFRCIRDT